MPDDNDVIRFKPSEMARAIRGITTATVAATLTINRNGIYSLDMSESGFTKLIVRVDEENKYSSSVENVTNQYYFVLDPGIFDNSAILYSSDIEILTARLMGIVSEFSINNIVFESSAIIVSTT